MTNYELMKAAAFAGDTGGGGGGGGVENYLRSEIEQGAINTENGENVDNTIRLRTKDATTLAAGDYSLFFTASGTMYARGMRYAADGAFIDTITGQDNAWLPAPVTFTAQEGQKFRFTFTVDAYSTSDMQVSDLHNLVLVKD